MEFLDDFEIDNEALKNVSFDELFPERLEEIEKLPSLAKMVLGELLQKYPFEEAIEIFLDTEDDTDRSFAETFCYSSPDLYFKLKTLTDDHPRHDIRFDEDGHIYVKNPSAWWIPELTIEREIGGTVYTVTGSFNGDEGMLRKLERISAKKFTNTEEAANDTDE